MFHQQELEPCHKIAVSHLFCEKFCGLEHGFEARSFLSEGTFALSCGANKIYWKKNHVMTREVKFLEKVSISCRG